MRRAEVFGRELARLALGLGGYGFDEDGVPWKPLVVAFREEFLEGRQLTDEEARLFLRSPAVFMLTPAQFKSADIPATGHTATQSRIDVRFENDFAYYGWTLTVRWEGSEVVVSVRRATKLGLTEILVPDPLHWHWRSALTDSLFARLSGLCETLAGHYDWKPLEAAWFILSLPRFRRQFAYDA